MITHAIPGRIRFRHGTAMTEERLEQLVKGIRDLAPSATVERNPGTGSILIRFLENEAGPAILELLGAGPAVANCPGRGVLAWPPMKQIKRGMALSLAASLGLLAARREGGHALLGGVFLGLLARHAWVYRKRLWK